MKGVKPAATPMSTTSKLTKDEKGKEVEEKIYRGIIRSLLYLTASRPDIMLSVRLYVHFQSCLKDSHISAIKISSFNCLICNSRK